MLPNHIGYQLACKFLKVLMLFIGADEGESLEDNKINTFEVRNC